MRAVIWVLTAGFGDGHNTAARNVADALRLRFPGERIAVSDFVREVHPVIAPALQALYRFLIVHRPSLWQWTYDTFAKPGMKHTAENLHPLVAAMHRLIERDRPRVIVSTFPLYAGLLEIVRRDMNVPPLVTVITDSITVHPAWVVSPSDRFCVADNETSASMKQHGVDGSRVSVTGFPVSLRLAQQTNAPRLTPSVLYMPSTGTAHVEETLESLRPLLLRGTQLTIVPGRHGPRLYQVLRRFSDALPGAPLSILSWTDDMPRLLQTHDLLICKAGGAILHEALAACIPAVIDYVVPGQEEGNAELLTSHGCGLRSTSAVQTGQIAADLLADNASKIQAMRERMKPLSVPDAAMQIAGLISKLF